MKFDTTVKELQKEKADLEGQTQASQRCHSSSGEVGRKAECRCAGAEDCDWYRADTADDGQASNSAKSAGQ